MLRCRLLCRWFVCCLSVLALANCSQPKYSSTTDLVKNVPMPPYPAWATKLMGREVHDVYPHASQCAGSIDNVLAIYTAPNPGTELSGWAIDSQTQQPVQRFVLVNTDGAIAGAGQGGFDRPDVPVAKPAITSMTTGWHGLVGYSTGTVAVWGVTGPQTVCFIGNVAVSKTGVAPVPVSSPRARNLPAQPQWAVALLGKTFRASFPKTTTCIGHLDGVLAKYDRKPKGSVLYGWAFDSGAGQPPSRVLIVNAQGVIIGGGESGVPRPDVPAAVPAVKSPSSGWQAPVGITEGAVYAWGIAQQRGTVCFVGEAHI